MATTYTPRAALGYPAVGDSGTSYNAAIQADIVALDGFNAIGGLSVTTHEVPSTTLNIKVAAGIFRNTSGAIVTYAGTASQAMTLSSSNYVYLTNTGTLTISTSTFPTGGTPYVPLAVVVAGATTITSIADARIIFAAVTN